MKRRMLVGLAVLEAACAKAPQGLDGGPARPPRDGGASVVASSSAGPVAPTVSVAGLPPLVTSEKAKVTLTLDKKSFFLGENVLVHYCIANASKAPITIDMGGDYRGASRSLRFVTTMHDARGKRMDDPDPHPFSMGGIGHSPEIAPGASYCQSLPLVRHARFDEPGTYTVRVVHDLGWPAGTAPGGETTVTFTAPSSAEAEGVIRAMETLPRDNGHSAGQKSAPWPDFTTLRHEVYVAPLLARVQQGNMDALDGLGAVPTATATRALVSLLAHATPAVARGAAAQLALRLPDPALAGSANLGPRNPFFNEIPEQRRYLSSVAWRPELSDEVRAAARRLLASSDPVDVKNGAFMLEAVGTKDDAPALEAALTAAIDRTATTPREEGIAPTPRGACQELLRTADVLVMRGVAAPAQPASTGQIALWLVANQHLDTLGTPAARPLYTQALAHTNTYVRRLAMERAPKNLDAASVKLVQANLASSDIDTQLAAAWLAESQSLKALAPSLVKVVSQTQDAYLLGVSARASQHLGAQMNRVNALVDRLGEPALTISILDLLLEIFGSNGRSAPNEVTAAEARQVQTAWRSFVTKHRADIDAGSKLPLDATTPVGLVPAGFIVHRSNQPNWPAGR